MRWSRFVPIIFIALVLLLASSACCGGGAASTHTPTKTPTPTSGSTYTSPTQTPYAPPSKPTPKPTPKTTYVLHVRFQRTTEFPERLPVTYSGDYAGTEIPPFDIGPCESPFTVTLQAEEGYTVQWPHNGGFRFENCNFERWGLDGVWAPVGDTQLTVTMDETRPVREVVVEYLCWGGGV